jgi:hypothetical protein
MEKYGYLQKVICRKTFVLILFFWGILKVSDENRRIRIRIRDPDPNPDPLNRGMDPRIRINTKMSWIHNTAGRPSLLAKSGLADDFSQNIFPITPPGNGNVGRGSKIPFRILFFKPAKICRLRNKPPANFVKRKKISDPPPPIPHPLATSSILASTSSRLKRTHFRCAREPADFRYTPTISSSIRLFIFTVHTHTGK